MSDSRKACPVKDNTRCGELSFPPDVMGWVIMMIAFVQGAWCLEEDYRRKLVEALKEQPDLRVHFLRQGMQKLLPREAWLGIYGTPEWELLEKPPMTSEDSFSENKIANWLAVHVEAAIPLPDDRDYLSAVLKMSVKDRRIARLVRENRETFLQLATKSKECIGQLFYCGLMEDEEEILSKMLGVKKTPWTLFSLMAIANLIPTILANILRKGYRQFSFIPEEQILRGAPIEEMRVWHTHVSELSRYFLNLPEVSEEVRAQFFPEVINKIDDLWCFVSNFDMGSVENLLMFTQGFNRAVRRMIEEEERMETPPAPGARVVAKIFSWVDQLVQHPDRHCYFILFAVSPYLVEKVLRERTATPNRRRTILVSQILRLMLNGNRITVNNSIQPTFVLSVRNLLNRGRFFFKVIAQTGCVNWAVLKGDSYIASITPLAFCSHLGRISVQPVSWRSAMYFEMHNALVDKPQMDAVFGRILPMVNEHREPRSHDIIIFACWLSILLRDKVVTESAMKEFIQSLPVEWRDELKSSRVPQSIKDQLRTLFEDDESRKLLEEVREQVEEIPEDVDAASEFGQELGKRLSEGAKLERIAKMQIIKCQSCDAVGGNALAKETSCCRKILCGRCSNRTLTERKCVSCQYGGVMLVQLNELDVDHVLETVFG